MLLRSRPLSKQPHSRHHLGRELSIKPRRGGYIHRDIIAVVDGFGVTEHGEPVRNLPLFAFNTPGCLWVTMDPASLLRVMLDRLGDHPSFNYQVVQTTEADAEVSMTLGARLTRFGLKRERGKRNHAMHIVWSPGDMSRAPGDYLSSFDHAGLLAWARDVREWCKEANLPLPTSLSGIAASLIRDARFWPHARGRVPTATNERLRPWLPGVYSELRAKPGRKHSAVAIDQRAAYHRAAQQVDTPDPTVLFARGYYVEPESSPLWAPAGTPLYERTIRQPGVVYVQYSAQPARKHWNRPPCIQPGRHGAALWTVEVPHVESQGVTIEGIVAAWTSSHADTGLPLYGAWAQTQVEAADDARKRWLKPTLHSVYGLLAMRTRQVRVGNHRGKGEPTRVIMGAGHEFLVHRHDLPPLPSATTNVAMLGVLQAEIRRRSLAMATVLSMEGATILHIHADGIHVAGDRLPLIPPEWSMKPRTNLEYLDRVSWTADEGDTLPGRDEQQRIAIRRHRSELHRLAHDRARAHRQAR